LLIDEVTMNDLGKKRLEAAWTIAGYATGGGAVSMAATPGVEVPKQVLLAVSDVLMYGTIWKIYFEEDLAQKELLEILAELGLVTVTATGAAYLVAEATAAIAREISNWLGPSGWGVSAIIASSLTATIGALWALHCDQLYQERQAQAEPPAATTDAE
jgi:hypothetical protein